MVGMNERLTTNPLVEKGMLQVTQINRTLTTMVHNFGELKTKVSNMKSDVNKLRSKSDTTESDIASIKNKNVNIDRDMKQMKKDNSETNRNMQGLSDFIDDFRAKHESNVKEVSGIRTAMSKAVNDFEDMSHELKQEIKVSINEGKQYGVNKQFPEAIEQARKSLYAVIKEMKAEGHRVRLVRDILYVDGLIYNHQTLNSPSPNNRRELLNTPEDYQSRKRRRRESRNSTHREPQKRTSAM
ncbi:hypothetical protein AM593_09605, partial [Mytilus galloprovincialis]